MLIGEESHQKKIQNYRPINKNLPAVFRFWPFKSVKRAPNGSKNMIFKIWLDTRPKMETHDPNVYPTILGGVSRGFWTPFLDWGARSAIFWHVKTPKVPVFTCQKMALRVPIQKNGDHFLSPTTPQNGVRHVCFMRLALLGGF